MRTSISCRIGIIMSVAVLLASACSAEVPSTAREGDPVPDDSDVEVAALDHADVESAQGDDVASASSAPTSTRTDASRSVSAPVPSESGLAVVQSDDLRIVVPTAATAEISSDEDGFAVYRIEVSAQWAPWGFETLPECWAVAESPEGKALNAEKDVTVSDTGVVIVLDSSNRPGQSVPNAVTVTCVHRDTRQNSQAATDIEWVTPGFCPSYADCPGDDAHGDDSALPESGEPTVSDGEDGGPAEPVESDGKEGAEAADPTVDVWGWPIKCAFRHQVIIDYNLWVEINAAHRGDGGFTNIAKAMSAEQWSDYVALTHKVGEGLDRLVGSGCVQHEDGQSREVLLDEQENLTIIRAWILDYAAARAGHYCSGAAERDGIC